MGPLATLTLFPPHSLDTSILAAVLIGVLLLALLTETLGWVFVGLVVPGYLASIFVINPEAAITVSAEALLTWMLAQLISRGVSATGAWSEFFGRERFFLIVICSVLIRALSEVVLLPKVGAYLDATYGTTFTIDRSLHSIGLVLVPLTANALWKLGLRRGVFQVAVPVAATWAILQFVLLPYTNLSFTSLELTYEDVAQRFLASPKAYIILLTTSLLAARYNLRYGWDFNGILVAALVALTWLGPLKLLATVAEVLILVLAARLLLSAPGVRTLNLEGPRKTVLVFVIGFLIKCAVGWALGGRIPGLKVTDLFGFGYLVPTLLAVKILQKQVTARVLLPTLHTSLAGVLVGSLIGFPLSLLEPKQAIAAPQGERNPILAAGLADTPLGVMALARATCRESDTGTERLRRRRWELRGWDSMWARIDEWLDAGNPSSLSAAREMAERLGLELRQMTTDSGREVWSLTERGSPVGWGAALLYPGSEGPVLEVARPLSEAPAAEASWVLCGQLDCRAILVSGVDTVWAKIARGDPLKDDTTALRRAHAMLERAPHVLVRADQSVARGGAVLFAPDAVAPWAERLWSGATREGAPPVDALEYVDDGSTGVLRVHPADLAALVTAAVPVNTGSISLAQVTARAFEPPPDARNPVVELPTPELTVLEDQIAAPLFAASNDGSIQWAKVMATLLGMEVLQVEGCEGGCWLLSEIDRASPRVGAALLVRTEGGSVGFEVPTPVRERGTLPVALEFFRGSNARALLFSDPQVEPPAWAPHVASPGVVRTSFQALHQALQRALPGGGMVVQVRGVSQRPGLGSDAVVTLNSTVAGEQRKPEALEALWVEDGPLAWMQGRVRYHDGTAELAGLTTPTPQQSYSRTFGGAQLATLWLSDALRGGFLPPRTLEEKVQVTAFATLPLQTALPQPALESGIAGPPGRPPSRKLLVAFEELTRGARRFVSQQGIHELRALQRPAAKGRVTTSVRLLHSPEHGLPFLLLEAREGRTVLRGVYFVSDAARPMAPLAVTAQTTDAAVAQALAQRAPLYLEGELAQGAGR